MPTARFSIRESSIRLFFGLLLWGVSATLTLVLLISLGDGTVFSKVLLGIVAIALEGAKILSWRKGGAYRVYAVALIVLSGIASLGASLQVVEKSSQTLLAISAEDLHLSPEYRAQESELTSIDTEIATLVDRIRSLPPDYTTATLKTESYLSALRDRRQALVSSIARNDEAVGASHQDGSMVALLGRTLGIRPDLLILILLLFVSAAIEVGALLLTVPDQGVSETGEASRSRPVSTAIAANASASRPNLPKASYGDPITPDAFLKAAMEGADLPFLNGRDRTAERLGITYADAKRLVGKLIEDGKIVVEGKRLRLIQTPRSENPSR